jgi:hypothetical protein
MEFSSLPVWAQQVGALLVTLGTAISLYWAEHRKRKDEPKVTSGGSDREVIAASFVGTRQMDDAIAVLRQIHTAVTEMNGHLEKANERAHEADMIAAIAAKMREERH